MWLLEGDLNHGESMYELGPEDSEVRFEDPVDPFWFDMAFTPDGVAWAKLGSVMGQGRLASFDGEGWTEQPLPDGSPIGAIEATPDGAILVTQGVTGSSVRTAADAATRTRRVHREADAA